MPSTVNGIGTHYYGKSDAASRPGVCQHCGAQGQLESYTTRLWFVILFIPIIPLKRVRLLDYCSRCSRHWVANPEQYEMSRQLAVSGALEKYRDAPSVESALVVHGQLLSFHMHQEADKFRETALERHSDSVELRSALGSHLDQMGRWMDATPLYEAAFKMKPELPEVRNSLAWRRMNENKLDEAYELLDFMRQPGASHSFNLGQLETLARAYQKSGQHDRVLEICAHLLSEIPATGDQHEFRKLVSKSERALDHAPSILPEKKFSVRGLLDSKSGTYSPGARWAVFGGLVALLFVIGMAGLNEYRRTHRTLYIVSGFAQPVSVSIDGGAAVPVVTRVPIHLSEGTHRISVTAPFAKDQQVTLQSGYWSRWTYSPAWVFNVEKTVALFENTIHYSLIPQPSTNKWLDEAEFNYVPHVDYLFEEPPQTIKVEKKSGTVTKIHVGTSPVPPTEMFVGLRSTDQSLAMTYAEGHLSRNAVDAALLNMYASRVEGEAIEKRVSEFLKAGLWKKPISVQWHREYQNLSSVRANEATLAAEYDEQLKQEPDNSDLLYLRGRVSSSHADELKYFRLAAEKNPQSGWASMALGYDAANRGDWKTAGEYCGKAANSLRPDPSFRSFWHVVRMANHEIGPMETEYRQQIQGQAFREAAAAGIYLADLLAAQGKYDEARQMTRQWITEKAGPAAAPGLMPAFDLMLDYMCGNLDRVRQMSDEEAATHPERFLFPLLLVVGKLDAAAKIADGEKQDKDWISTLALSTAYSIARNSDEADKWLTKTCELLANEGGKLVRAAELLKRDTPPSSDELDEVGLLIQIAPLYLAKLSQRFPEKKSELVQRAQNMNISRQHPYLLVKQALETP